MLLEHPCYRVITEHGKIETTINRQGWPTDTWREKPQCDHDGYRYISFYGKKLFVHRIIYQAHYGRLRSDMEVNHKDGNPSNNSASNLEQLTPSKNNCHKFRVLKHPPVIGNSKIDLELAEKIRADRLAGCKYKDLMEKYNLAKSTISYIVNNLTWKTA